METAKQKAIREAWGEPQTNEIFEIWKDAFGLEGYYQVSSTGRLKSIPREISLSNGKKGISKSKILKPYVNKYGYVKYSLVTKNGKKTINGHIIVAKTFIPNPENKPQVNHINGIKTDNRIDNLEWATREENMQHAHLNGLMNTPSGSNHCMFNKESHLHPRARKVINKTTKEIFGCKKDAAKSISCNISTFTDWLNRPDINKTDFIWYDDYISNNGWIELPTKEFLKHGHYWIKVKHPKTGVEDVFVHHLNEGPGIIGFAYATHYQPIEKPQSPIY